MSGGETKTNMEDDKWTCVREISQANTLAMSADGFHVYTGIQADENKTIKVWHVATGECVQTLVGHPYYVQALCLSNKHLFSAGHGDTITMWDVNTSKRVKDFHDTSSTQTLCVSGDGSRLFSTHCSTINVWDVATGKCVKTLESSNLQECCVSADGLRLFSSSFDMIQIWDVETGTCVLDTSVYEATVYYSMCVSADGKRLYSAIRNVIKVWDTDTGKCMHTLRGHQGGVQALCLSNDETRLFSGCTDHTVKVWDVATGNCVQTMQHGTFVISLCVVATGSNTVVLSGGEDTIKVWSSLPYRWRKFMADMHALVFANLDGTVNFKNMQPRHSIAVLVVKAFFFRPVAMTLKKEAEELNISLPNYDQAMYACEKLTRIRGGRRGGGTARERPLSLGAARPRGSLHVVHGVRDAEQEEHDRHDHGNNHCR